ncbi:hypothetical protein B0H13DRAFT_1891756 [Mycena leptocephala]|nr:hypothetical protein B0H13DRAFT_1891756 [Mycena leptocephala]
MQPTLPGWVFLSAIAHGSLAQTIYGLLPSNLPILSLEGSISMSAAGVGDDGWTTYIGTRVISVEVLGGSTITDSPPITITGTIVEGASGFRESTCTFGADGQGACVVAGMFVASSTGTTTISGVAVPFYTFAAATTTGATPPASTNAAPLRNTTASQSMGMVRTQIERALPAEKGEIREAMGCDLSSDGAIEGSAVWHERCLKGLEVLDLVAAQRGTGGYGGLQDERLRTEEDQR